MMNYLFESTVCITLFYGLYLLIFRRLTFIRLNRVYLIGALVLGLSLPLISWEIEAIILVPSENTTNTFELTNPSEQLQYLNISTPIISNTPIEKPFDWALVLRNFYCVGIVLMLGKLLLTITQILRKQAFRISSKKYIPIKGKFANSSFFNLIFIDDSELSEIEINQVFAHENWHIKLYHSYDLLFAELVKIVFWFNPVLWFYQRSLTEVHEYEVDTRMVATYNPREYAHLLLKLATPFPQLVTAHYFSKKPLTDRINFLFNKQKSIPMKRLAYLSILPIFGVLFMAFSVEEVVKYQEVVEPKKHFKIIKNEDFKDYPNITILKHKVVATLYLNKDQIAYTVGSDKVSTDAINDAARYFKDYGFTLKMVNKQTSTTQKGFEKLQISLTKDEENKQKEGKPNTEKSLIKNNENLEIMRLKSDKNKGNIIMILADRASGVHYVSPLNPPSPPPKNIPPPPEPPLPVKVGLGMREKIQTQKLLAEYFKNKSNLTKIVGHLEIDTWKDVEIKGTLDFDFKSHEKLQKLLNSSENSHAISVNNVKISIQDDYNKVINFSGIGIAKNLYIEKSLVSHKKWQDFLDYINHDKYFSVDFRKKMIPSDWDKIIEKSDILPVINVSHEQANEYCKWRTNMINNKIKGKLISDYQSVINSNKPSGNRIVFRLPTEKEWELATKSKLIANETIESVGFVTVLECTQDKGK